MGGPVLLLLNTHRIDNVGNKGHDLTHPYDFICASGQCVVQTLVHCDSQRALNSGWVTCVSTIILTFVNGILSLQTQERQ